MKDLRDHFLPAIYQKFDRSDHNYTQHSCLKKCNKHLLKRERKWGGGTITNIWFQVHKTANAAGSFKENATGFVIASQRLFKVIY